jgi:DEAD/DEAH box helicase.
MEINNMSTHIQHPAMRLQIAPIATTPPESVDGFLKLRDWQVRCLDELRGSRQFIINAPMASGKSLEICALASWWLAEDSSLKVIIAVPQTNIADGFRRNRIALPDGDRVEWAIKECHDLCRQSPKSSTAHLLGFLHAAAHPSLNPMDRVLLCTHSTLVRAFKTDPAVFKNVLIVIDEAHHVRHSVEDGVTAATQNQMGALVAFALQKPDTITLGLTTATFFRGDCLPIVPDVSKFTRFNLAYDEFLGTCQHLRSFSYDFIIQADFFTPVKRLFQERIGKTLVYIPFVNSSYSIGTSALARIYPPVLSKIDPGILN